MGLQNSLYTTECSNDSNCYMGQWNAANAHCGAQQLCEAKFSQPNCSKCFVINNTAIITKAI